MSDEILILGPTGNVGSRLTEILLQAGLSVRTGNRQDFDFFRPETYGPMFRGVEKLFLVTPVAQEMVELNAVLLKEARKAGVKKIVRLSALGASPQAPTRLFRWHAECEDELRASGIPFVILRPNAFMQNFSKYYSPMIRRRQGLYVPGGRSRISFIDAWDVASIAAAALQTAKRDGETLELTGQVALSFPEAAAILSSQLGRPIPYIENTTAEARQGMLTAGYPAWKTDLLLELYQFYQMGSAEKVNAAVPLLLGRLPRSFNEFIATHREDFL